MFNPFLLILVLVAPPFVAPLLLVWFARLFGDRAARVVTKAIVILVGTVLVICLAALALFRDQLGTELQSADTLITLSIAAAGLGVLGARTGLASLRLLSNRFPPASGG